MLARETEERVCVYTSNENASKIIDATSEMDYK